LIITIDGPVASGKTTAARNLAAALGFSHLDSGALYRALALLCSQRHIDPEAGEAVRAMLVSADLRTEGDRVFLDGRDVSSEIRHPDVTRAVKPLAENADVREFVKSIQRKFAEGRDIVAEGRDMGTVIFPEAEVKLYLTCSDAERAKRRWGELHASGVDQDYETVLAELRARDESDMNRAIAPLRKPAGAVEVDSTGLEPGETLRRLERIVREKTGGRA
jgi:cytidylate kinase